MGEKTETQTGDKSDEDAVASLVKDFGSKLQMVSLQAPTEILKKSLEENYGRYVSKELLAKWAGDPLNAPGRLTSSPWPDRIEVSSVSKLSDGEYEVKGEIIEITSAEKVNSGVFAKRPVTLSVKKTDNRWLIYSASLGAYENNSSITYKNTKYGFDFLLPGSWTGYTIVSEKWEGLPAGDSSGEKDIETGPMLSIRHPLWTQEKPRQDIPIMIFTLEQWNMLQQDKFHIGAAPINPSELGRNSGYVFALPARYNYAFPEGYEEVENILNGKPLHPVQGTGQPQ
jgi:hypothetical protein